MVGYRASPQCIHHYGVQSCMTLADVTLIHMLLLTPTPSPGERAGVVAKKRGAAGGAGASDAVGAPGASGPVRQKLVIVDDEPPRKSSGGCC